MTELKHSVSAHQLNSSLTKGFPKMSKLKTITGAIGIAFIMAVTAPVAAAQVLVVDSAKVFVDSKAGKDLTAKVKTIGKSMETELTPEKTALETEKNALVAKTQGKTREQVQADTALVAQTQAYVRKQNTFLAKADKRARELAATERTALTKFAQAMRAAAEKVKASQNGKIVLDKSNVYIMDASEDITSAVIAELDKTTPTITVTRISLPDQPQTAAKQ